MPGLKPIGVRKSSSMRKEFRNVAEIRQQQPEAGAEEGDADEEKELDGEDEG